MRFPVRRVEKPWGHELVFAHTLRYVGKLLHIEPGHALSLQYHERKDETFFVARGSISRSRRRAGSCRASSARATPITSSLRPGTG
jgi:mannose-6-phosphate isomerase-like protein (cupin superfamily)